MPPFLFYNIQRISYSREGLILDENKKCLLSVAMIVKDEEHNIRRALESIKDIADEIIVVDTGSKDRTPEIVREYTNKLYFHEWKDDFSEARNYSLKFPTCEWVLILDADEEASSEFRKNIRAFLNRLSNRVNTVYVPALSYFSWDFTRFEIASTARIFRNGTVYYKNIVHNQPIYKPEVVDFPYKIIHYGYIWTRELKKKKYERTKNLIMKHLKNTTSEIEELYYLIQLYKTEEIGGKPYQKYETAFRIYKKLEKCKRIPGIGLEFLFLFGTECANEEFFELSEKLLGTAIKIAPQYPDPYYGMLALYERQENWEKVMEYGKKFLKKVEEAMKKVETFKWTLMTLKERATAYLLLAKASIELKNFQRINIYMEGFLNHMSKMDIPKVSYFTNSLSKLNNKELRTVLPAIIKIAKFYREKSFEFYWDEFVRIFLSNGVFSEEMIELFTVKDKFYKRALEHYQDKNRDYLLETLFDDNVVENALKRQKVGDLLFLFDYFKNDNEKILSILNKARKSVSKVIRGVSLALMGDVYFKKNNIKEALNFYKKAMEELPEISSFVKPVIEDLKLRIDVNIEGTFEELYKYYLGKKEILIATDNLLPKDKLEKLYFVSSHPVAFYISAIYSDDKKKSKELLEKIPEEVRFKFPFYYYRLAKAYEDTDKEKAFKYHVKACQENENLGDIKYGIYKYNGFYPHEIPKFFNNNDDIVWVGNLTEKYTTFGAINPVKMWKKSKKDFYYSYPFALMETIRKYYRKEEKMVKGMKPFRIDKYQLLKVLSKLNIDDLMIFDFSDLELTEDFSYLTKELSIDLTDNSLNILIPYGAEIYKEEKFLTIIDNRYNRIFLIFRVPDFDDKKDPLWYYPPFRFIRPYSYWKKLLKKHNYNIKSLEVLDKNTRMIIAEK